MPNRDVQTNVIIKGRAEGLNQVSQQLDQLGKTASATQEKLTKGFAAAQQSTTRFAQNLTQDAARVSSGPQPRDPGRGPAPQFQDPGRPPPRDVGGAGGTGGPGGRGGGGLQVDFEPLLRPLHELREAIEGLAAAVREGRREEKEKEPDTTKEREKAQQQQKDQENRAREAEQKRGSFLHGFLQTALPTMAAPFLQRGPGMARQAFGQLAGQTLTGVAGGLGNAMVSGMPGIQQAIAALPAPGANIAAGMLGVGASYGEMAMRRHRTRLENLPLLLGGATPEQLRQGRLPSFSREALNYGAMSQEEAYPLLGAALQTGGGGLRGMREQRMLGATLVGQRLFGLGGETTGAFLQAGRRGGLAGTEAGTPGAGGEAMAKSVAAGMRLGLQGSELTNYMRTVAEGISQWQQTGIPFPQDAFTGIADELAKSGMAGPRGLNVAQGVVGAAQALSRGGPQNAAQLMMLQTMGGFQGGGAEAFERAQIQLEQGKYTGGDYQQLVKRYLKAGGGGAAGRLLARQMMGGMGINIGAEEMSLLGRQAEGETLTTKEQKRLAQIQKEQQETKGPGGRIPKNLDDMLAMGKDAMDKWGGVVKAQAALQERQTNAGEKMIPAMLTLQDGMTTLAGGFVDLAKGPLLELTRAMTATAKAAVSGGVGAAVGVTGRQIMDWLGVEPTEGKVAKLGQLPPGHFKVRGQSQ